MQRLLEGLWIFKIPPQSDGGVLKLGAQLCDCTKNPGIIHLTRGDFYGMSIIPP